MLRSIKKIYGYKILAQDNEFGHVNDFYFDDVTWMIRYLIVDTGNWLPGRKVLIPPSELDHPSWSNHALPVSLTKKQVENCPSIGLDEPVSRQYEAALHTHFGWEPYWIRGGMMPPFPTVKRPGMDQEAAVDEAGETPLHKKEGDPHLRSSQEVIGYHIQATDGEIGHVEDFIVDDELWDIRYMIVDTRNWLLGRKVLVAIPWIERVSWGESKVFVDLSKEKVKNSPKYDPLAPVNREYEEVLYDFYGRPKYWM
jgi:uncharacterized protein YrrD